MKISTRTTKILELSTQEAGAVADMLAEARRTGKSEREMEGMDSRHLPITIKIIVSPDNPLRPRDKN